MPPENNVISLYPDERTSFAQSLLRPEHKYEAIEHNPFDEFSNVQLHPVEHDPFVEQRNQFWGSQPIPETGARESAAEEAAKRMQRSIKHREIAQPTLSSKLPDNNYFMPGLEEYQTGKFNLPSNTAMNEAGEVYDKTTGKVIPEARRPGVLPLTRNPTTGEAMWAMPKISEAAGYVTGPLGAAKSSGTLGSGFLRTGPKATEAIKATAPPFYSAVEKAVTDLPLKSAPAEQWINTLRNTPGIKQEELSWLGLDDWLREQKGPVSKEALQDYIGAHKVELKEITKGQPDPAAFNKLKEDVRATQAEHGRLYEQYNKVVRSGQDTQAIQEQIRQNRDQYYALSMKEREFNSQPPKFGAYQVPGGENYKEMLLQLPTRGNAAEIDKVTKRLDELAEIPWAEYQRNPAAINQESDTLRSRLIKLRDDDFNSRNGEKFKSSHWPEPNILAHVRMNDRTINGKKTLLLEELQSDWHQIARDKGYVTPESQAAAKDRATRIQQVTDRMEEMAKDRLPNNVIRDERGWMDLARERDSLYYQQSANKSRVPNAPFKSSWPALALKRMMRYASENGYDQLAITSGETQAERFKLANHIDRIEYNPKTGRFWAWRPGEDASSTAAVDTAVKPEELRNYVGPEIAERIMNATQRNGRNHVVTDLNTVIGGEGMLKFYDDIIPNTANRIAKQHGSRIERGQIPAAPEQRFGIFDQNGQLVSEYRTAENAQKYLETMQKNKPDFYKGWTAKPYKIPGRPHNVHVLPLTPQLKDTAIGKGFPMFVGGMPVMPVEHDPFQEKRQ